MNRVLMSACLAGERVRYDGGDKSVQDSIMERWRTEGRLVLVCPELAGGLAVPRPAAEIQGEGGGLAVLAGDARVADREGRDVTLEFVRGAEEALRLAQAEGIRVAVLTDRSPSCGSTTIHDGTFSSGMRPGLSGVTAALLRRHGIAVFSEHQLVEANRLLLQSADPAR